MKHYASMLGETVKHLIFVLILPLSFGMVATFFQYYSISEGWSKEWKSSTWFEIVSAYFVKVFFIGAYWGYATRSWHKVQERRNHESVTQKQLAVLTRLEGLSAELGGHATGGDGFCYILHADIRDNQIVCLYLAVEGGFALRDVSIGISSLESVVKRVRLSQETGDIAHALTSDDSFALIVVIPNVIKALHCKLALNGQISKFWIRYHAANGHWTQQIEYDASSNKMRARVHRQDGSIFVSPSNTSPADEDWMGWEHPTSSIPPEDISRAKPFY